MDVLEALETCRAIRYLKPDPVPDELIEKLIHGATRASNPGNSQGWEFVVLRERAMKERIGEVLHERLAPAISAIEGANEVEKRTLRGAARLLEGFADVPLWILVCGRLVYPPEAPSEQMVWSTVYPAAQNLIVTARAHGLGTTFTTFQGAAEAEIRAELGIPNDVLLGVSVAVGWPDRAFGPVARKPVSDVLHWDRW